MHTVKRTKTTSSLLVLHLPSLSFQPILHYDIIFLTSMELGRHKIISSSSEMYCSYYVRCYYYYYYYNHLKYLLKKQQRMLWTGLIWLRIESSGSLFFVIKPTRCTNFTNLFCHESRHVSDSSSVRHQEFIHCTLSNGICQTGL